MKSIIDVVIGKLRMGEDVALNDLKFGMGAVMCAVLLSSWSRPCAVTQCTMDEFENMFRSGSHFIIKVHEHKTASSTGMSAMFITYRYCQTCHQHNPAQSPLTENGSSRPRCQQTLCQQLTGSEIQQYGQTGSESFEIGHSQCYRSE